MRSDLALDAAIPAYCIASRRLGDCLFIEWPAVHGYSARKPTPRPSVSVWARFPSSSLCLRLRAPAGQAASYDTDLLDTLLNGRAWLSPSRQPCHPINHESA
jgi:hypothetical protein